MNFLDNRLPDRFWDKIQPCPITGCWLWFGALSNGYGYIRVDGSSLRAHRFCYELLRGPIQNHLDHKCRIRCCVNPAHLEDVTNLENTRRGNSLSAVTARSNTCQRGHVLSPENVIIRKNDTRNCAQCALLRSRMRSKKWWA